MNPGVSGRHGTAGHESIKSGGAFFPGESRISGVGGAVGPMGGQTRGLPGAVLPQELRYVHTVVTPFGQDAFH